MSIWPAQGIRRSLGVIRRVRSFVLLLPLLLSSPGPQKLQFSRGGPYLEVRMSLRRALKIHPKFDEEIGGSKGPQNRPKIDPRASKTAPREAPEVVPENMSKFVRFPGLLDNENEAPV